MARVTSAAPEQLMATVLLRELRERCYADVYKILKDFPPRLPPVMAPEPMIRFETAPPTAVICSAGAAMSRNADASPNRGLGCGDEGFRLPMRTRSPVCQSAPIMRRKGHHVGS